LQTTSKALLRKPRDGIGVTLSRKVTKVDWFSWNQTDRNSAWSQNSEEKGDVVFVLN
jgi:hypothetical protein